ncbi:TonB family protein [Bryobacter aggregatus]|uniref:TonB family protein n=1 Tax=Bryobacter aggregatus TaxID=360054 RepID=UPI0009B5A6F9|nr:TonB family protein [Bryobacter aggregatus]
MTAVPTAASPHGFRNSLLLHVGVIAALVGYEWWMHQERDHFGEKDSLGASAGISSVSQIPIPRRDGRVNKVANDTDTQIPTPVKPQPKSSPKPEQPDAIPIKKKEKLKEKKSKQEQIASTQKYREDPVVPNQVPSNLGQAAVSPMIGVQGSGGVGTSSSSPFGNRFGWYEKLIRERVSQKWHTDDVDPRIRNSKPCIVTFSIARDGTVSAVKIAQTSGVYGVDLSAQRAVLDANPLPPLPTGFERNIANIEFWFELKR